MTVDYDALKKENVVRYGTDIGRIGQMLLANRYDKRTHFIYELLQNAEDALRRRSPDWEGPRSVAFDLSEDTLVVAHYGKPFDEPDVRGVCGIDESTKDITSIGRFGIGFKSVYSFTKRPEIHSGDEAFAIETYVWPVSVEPCSRASDQTKIILPLEKADIEAQAEIVEGLQNLGARTLLFLRNVKEISWTAPGGASGLYFRDDPTVLAPGVREISLMGQQRGQDEIEERWLVFSKEVEKDEIPVGNVEIAFRLSVDLGQLRKIEPLIDSTLVVFFPTILSTHTGFLVQGPYRTTPSRDNIPTNDAWNKYLVGETGSLLVEALRWLKDQSMLDVDTLLSLPLERERFAGGLLAPLFDRIVHTLKNENFLPCSDSTYASAKDVQLSRTQDLRDLFDSSQLGALLKGGKAVRWLSSDITADRTPALRQYLLRELSISERSPESLLPRLNVSFLEAQSDTWIVRLYEYLNKAPAVADRLRGLPLVRLENGKHVPAFLLGMPQAFFPSDIETGFPTIRKSVCKGPDATKFLQSLGLTAPDPVDDVIRNLLPVYKARTAKPENYAADMARTLQAFKTDSTTQRQKLVAALKGTPFVIAREMNTGKVDFETPENVYVATARLRDLYDGIPGIHLADDNPVLRGEPMRELLEACGAVRYIYPVQVRSTLTESQKFDLRLSGGQVKLTSEAPITDYSLRGLEKLFEQFPSLSLEARRLKARLLWEALVELQDRRGEGVFTGLYRWHYHQMWSEEFDTQFIRRLNQAWWIPDTNGDLVPPSSILFETTGWSPHPFLQSKIAFKKPIVEELAKEAGFEPGMLDMLKKLGLTSTAELMARLNVEDLLPEQPPGGPGTEESDGDREVDDAEETASDGKTEGTETSGDENGKNPSSSGESDHSGDSETGNHGKANGGSGSAGDNSGSSGNGSGGGSRGGAGASRSRKPGERTFVSYVAMHPLDGEDEDDPDGLDQAQRLALEAKAIALIQSREPLLKSTPAGNQGFDLVEADVNDEPERWVEVKAMKGTLEDRPVGLSSAQFEFARQHGEQFWLYVVEHADDPDRARIVKIQDPVGKAGSFTFDKGWGSIALIDQPSRK
ncbi:MAG: sacsin N-terminal ATP-binding-like domain-containing protein [Parvibaculaceae bacterium]